MSALKPGSGPEHVPASGGDGALEATGEGPAPGPAAAAAVPPGWRWKVADVTENAALDLLYEPGNWGDVLKGAWLVTLMARLLEGAPELRVLDPWAGAPLWPLVEGAGRRLESLPEGSALRDVQARFVQAGQLASTGRLALELARDAGVPVSAQVFDLDAARRARWAAEPDVRVLDLQSGEQALGCSDPQAERDRGVRQLTLIDPYDLFETYEQLLPAALATGEGGTLLFYLFNKAPRGAAAHRRYRDMRALMDSRLGADRRLLVGRLPSDAVLPRAFHEVWLVAASDDADALRDRLQSTTFQLAQGLAEAGAFEG